jgi:hypothetical protein
MTWVSTIVALAALGAGRQASAAAAPVAVPPGWVEDFRRIAQAHRDLRAFDLEIEAVVATGESRVPIRANVKCDERHRCLRQFLSSTTLETPQVSVMVNNVTRTIAVARREQAEPPPLGAVDPTKNLEQLVEQGGSVSGGEETPGGRHWVIATGQATLPSLEMYVDADTHLVRRLTYQTTTPEGAETHVEVSYTWRDPSRLDPSAFDVEQFVREQSGTFTPAKDYANYSIVTSTSR